MEKPIEVCYRSYYFYVICPQTGGTEGLSICIKGHGSLNNMLSVDPN